MFVLLLLPASDPKKTRVTKKRSASRRDLTKNGIKFQILKIEVIASGSERGADPAPAEVISGKSKKWQ